MTIETATTATHLLQVDTSRETYIGYEGWSDADTFYQADYLYLRKGSYWQYQDENDAGKRNGPGWSNSRPYTYVENRNLAEHYASRFELTPTERERAVSFVLSQDLGGWGVDKRFVAWATCAYVVHSDERDLRKAHPLCKNSSTERTFREFANELGMSERERHKMYGRVQDKFARSRWGEGYINRSILSMVDEEEADPIEGTITPIGYDSPETDADSGEADDWGTTYENEIHS